MSSQALKDIPTLTGTANYATWQHAMKAYLLSIGVWTYTIGVRKDPGAPTQSGEDPSEEYVAWLEKDGQALGAITLKCTPKICS